MIRFPLVSGRSFNRKMLSSNHLMIHRIWCQNTYDFITVSIFPDILQLSYFLHRPTLQTLSNALVKSMKAHYSFNLRTLRYSISACITSILSDVEYDARKPHWVSLNILLTSRKVLSRVFNIAVNNLPMQLSMVMGRWFSGRVWSPFFVQRFDITN